MFGVHGTCCASLRPRTVPYLDGPLFSCIRKKIIRAVQGHFAHPYDREWMNIADTVTPLLAELVGE